MAFLVNIPNQLLQKTIGTGPDPALSLAGSRRILVPPNLLTIGARPGAGGFRQSLQE